MTGGARTAVSRRQTLRTVLDWTAALCSEPERVVFRRLAVFPGGFDLAAAHAVSGGPAMSRAQLRDRRRGLVDRSLELAGRTGRGASFRLPEPVRQYALEKLCAAGVGPGADGES